MVYIFQRDDEVVRVESRFIKTSETFQIICRRADGTTTQENFNGETAFRSRLDEIRADLERAAWRSTGTELVPDGWNI